MANINLGSKDKSAVYYDPPITDVVPPVRDLLENYAHIPPKDVVPRLIEMVGCCPCPCLLAHRLLRLCSPDPLTLVLPISLPHRRSARTAAGMPASSPGKVALTQEEDRGCTADTVGLTLQVG